LEVYTPIGNWPNSIYFLTNYGLFKFDFPCDLTSIDEINKIG